MKACGDKNNTEEGEKERRERKNGSLRSSFILFLNRGRGGRGELYYPNSDFKVRTRKERGGGWTCKTLAFLSFISQKRKEERRIGAVPAARKHRTYQANEQGPEERELGQPPFRHEREGERGITGEPERLTRERREGNFDSIITSHREKGGEEHDEARG